MQAYRITHVRVVTMSSLFWRTSQNCRHPAQECCVLEALGVGYFFKHWKSLCPPRDPPSQCKPRRSHAPSCPARPSHPGWAARRLRPLHSNAFFRCPKSIGHTCRVMAASGGAPVLFRQGPVEATSRADAQRVRRLRTHGIAFGAQKVPHYLRPPGIEPGTI